MGGLGEYGIQYLAGLLQVDVGDAILPGFQAISRERGMPGYLVGIAPQPADGRAALVAPFLFSHVSHYPTNTFYPEADEVSITFFKASNPWDGLARVPWTWHKHRS